MWAMLRPRVERGVVSARSGCKRPRSSAAASAMGGGVAGAVHPAIHRPAFGPAALYACQRPLLLSPRLAGANIVSLSTSYVRHKHDKARNSIFSLSTSCVRHKHDNARNNAPGGGGPPTKGKPTQRGKPTPKRWFSPQFSKCQTLDKALDLAHNHLDKHTPRDLSAFWTITARFLSKMERKPKRHEKQVRRMHEKFESVSNKTLEGIGKYSPRDMSTVALSYAKIVSELGNPRKPKPRGCPHHILHALLVGKGKEIEHEVFSRIAKSSIYTLPDFVAQDLSNFIYAYGIIGFVPQLEDGGSFFNMVATEVIWALDNHDEFSSQAVSNIAWSFSTLRVKHPRLFEKLAQHIVKLDNLDGFWSQALSNVAWAFANAGEHHPELFDKIAAHIAGQESLNDFIPQHLANIAWAFATNGHVDKKLFEALVPELKAKLGRFRCQELSNVAWAYAVADVAAPSLFDSEFVEAVVAKDADFKPAELRQLYQWILWQEELQSDVSLPPSLQERCKSAFVAVEVQTSALEDDVVSELIAIGLEPQRQVLLESGYILDAMMEVNGATIGIEVDGPSHFVGRDQQKGGGTILKRRQVRKLDLDGVELVSVPHWVWKKQYGEPSPRMQQYLKSLLGLRDDNEEVHDQAPQ